MEINLKDLDAGMGQAVKPVGKATPIGTHNIYAVEGVKLYENPAWHEFRTSDEFTSGGPVYLIFQDGNPFTAGVNGASMESLLLACADRLKDFQANDITACPENQAALDAIKQAVYALNQRTQRLEHERELKSSN